MSNTEEFKNTVEKPTEKAAADQPRAPRKRRKASQAATKVVAANDAAVAVVLEESKEKPARSRRRRPAKTGKTAAKAAQAGKAEKESAKAPKTGAKAAALPKAASSKKKERIDLAALDRARKARVYEIDNSLDSADLPKIQPILPEWKDSAPERKQRAAAEKTAKAVTVQRTAENTKENPAGEKGSAKPVEKKKATPEEKLRAKVKAQNVEAARQTILEKLSQSETVLSPENLLGEMSIPAADFYLALDELELEGKVFTNRKQKVGLPAHMGYLSGKLSVTARGFGFLTPDDESEDVFIPAAAMNGALHGDLVVVRPVQGQPGRGRDARDSREGEVLAVTEHANLQMVGTFRMDGTRCFLVPDNQRLGKEFAIHSSAKGSAKDGQKVVCSLEYADGKVIPKVVEVLGYPDEKGTDVLSIIRAHDLPDAFPRHVLAAARAVPQEVQEDDIIRREDLRGKTVVTIDGRDSKDFDDAVSLEKLENGNYMLGVHIADVAQYVEEGSALDKEALKRGNSVYFIDRVIPMLPEELSNGICSLNPHVDRLALSCFMEIDGKGKVVNHRIAETVIRSTERLVYEDVSAALAGDETQRTRYAHIMPMLEQMEELYAILNRKRMERGSLEFDFPECKIDVDENGKPTNIYLAERGVSNRIIEEFMLICNETVGEHMAHLKKPMIYRVHEVPDLEKIEELNTFLGGFGLFIRGAKQEIRPKAIQNVLRKVQGRPEEYVVSRVALRSLKKARYCEENLGHFGLAAEYYCHFTSPIRRYADMITHRVIKLLLRGKLSDAKVAALRAAMPGIAERTSDCEREAMMAERDVDDLKKCEYMMQFVGQKVDGIISGVTSFGIFVELPNTCEGLVRIAEMRDDYYTFDEANYRYVGRHRGKIFRLGDPITVIVAAADAATRRVDFTLEQKEPPRSRPQRPNPGRR